MFLTKKHTRIGLISMTQVHFTFESEEIQKMIHERGDNDTAKTLVTVMFNQLMEEQRNQYIQAGSL